MEAGASENNPPPTAQEPAENPPQNNPPPHDAAGDATQGATEEQPQELHQSNGVNAEEQPIMEDQTQFQAQDPTMMPDMPLQPDEQMMMPQPMSADEIALYDRQIRLWGVQAQQMIRTAHVLVVGMKALGNEIAKNLVLAGIGGLTILDHENVTEDDLSSQFLVTADDVGKNRAEAAVVELRKMNPRVNIFPDTEMVINKIPEYFGAFNVVIVVGQPFDLASAINMNCRMWNTKFYAADMHGLYGYVFADLVMHSFIIEKERGNIATKPNTAETPFRMVNGVDTRRENDKTIEIVTKTEMYSPFLISNASQLPDEAIKNRRTKAKVTPLISCLRALFEFQKQSGRLPQHNRQDLQVYTKFAQDRHIELSLPAETLSAAFLRSFMQNLGTELTPTAAFLGGHLAQDVINVLSQKEQPLQNMLFFDGEELKAPIYSIHPMFDNTVVMDQGMSAEETTLPMMNGMQETEA